MSTDASEPRGRRRKAAKAVEKIKLTLRVDVETAERFKVHALKTRKEHGELFAEMVRAHCRRFVVHDHAKDPGESAEAGAA